MGVISAESRGRLVRCSREAMHGAWWWWDALGKPGTNSVVHGWVLSLEATYARR